MKVNYGNDSEADGTFVQIGGPTRYRILMNFSNLSFFDDHYTRDAEGNDMRDTTVGGASAYAYLASLPYVDATRLALTGHSMGTWSSWSVAAAFANSTDEAGKSIAPKAIVLQCGELFRELPTVYDVEHIHFNNVLLLQAKYDEFSYFRDYQLNVTDDLLKTPLRYEFLGTTAEGAAWDKTFGTFADGTARRIELLNTNHRLTTHNRHGLATALEWFGTALDHQTSLAPTDQVAMIKECLVLTAMLASLFAMLPLLNLLLAVPIFNPVQQGLPDRSTLKGAGSWIFAAFLTIVLSAASFPFMTQLGHGLLPLPENIFKMTVGNGFVGWYLTLIVIMLVTTCGIPMLTLFLLVWIMKTLLGVDLDKLLPQRKLLQRSTASSTLTCALFGRSSARWTKSAPCSSSSTSPSLRSSTCSTTPRSWQASARLRATTRALAGRSSTGSRTSC